MSDLKDKRDEELVSVFLSGNEFAFEELYRRYAPKLKKFIYFYLGNDTDMEDILHEIFIRFFRHAGSFNQEMNFSSWIYKISLNSCKNYIGTVKRTGEIIEKEKIRLSRSDNYYESPEAGFIGEVDLEYFRSAVDSLKDKFKDVFLLRYEENMKYADICKILKCSERAAKWRVMKAVELITDYLEKKNVV